LTAILGPKSSGKSALLNILGRKVEFLNGFSIEGGMFANGVKYNGDLF